MEKLGGGTARGDKGVQAESAKAAEYVRMSTEHQRYSTENQSDAIRQYASQRSLEIVRTYEDSGKSGLRLDGRDALKRLIQDVQSGQADFETILVYDVSRWGRFQDADESAYYEYICKRAGISVQYCAEQFENDGSPVSTIVKGVKRAMAGEYSRELSTKVFAGQCRLIELGFRQGGPPGYGLRRALIDQAGQLKNMLTRGEHKSIQTDRVVLVPGPLEEIETVQWMYRSFVERRMTEREIAVQLNSRGIMSDLGRPWTRGTVHQVLINHKYVGDNVWNRVSFKLKKLRIVNRPEQWIRSTGVFKPIVDRGLFDAAQAIIFARTLRVSNEDMLEGLKQLFDQRGYLSGLVIDESPTLPSSSAYQHRFGSLLQAYQLVGYTTGRDYRYLQINRALRLMHPNIVKQVTDGIGGAGGSVVQSKSTDAFTINGEFTASIVIVRCQQTPAGARRWKIRLDASLCPDITVAVRMQASNEEILDYYLLPRLETYLPRIRLADHNGLTMDAFRFETLDPFYELCARVNVMEVA